MSNLNYIFLQLQLIYGVDLHERKSVIIFDEVQLCPKARQAIKTLVQDHRYDYIETGSLISIKKNVMNILIPSEERKLSMYPMDYEEFLWALGDTTTIPILKQCFSGNIGLGDKMNRKLLRDFRLYMLVGEISVNVITEASSTQKMLFISESDIEMDNRARAAVRSAIDRAKVCKKPIAKYDPKTKRAYVEYADGEKKYVN